MYKKVVFSAVVIAVILVLSAMFGGFGSVRGIDEEETKERSPYPFPNDYPTVSQYYSWYDNLTAEYPDLCMKINIGQSWEGRDLWALKISDNVTINEDEPEGLFDGNIHSREWSTSQSTAYFGWRLLNEYDTNETIHWLVNHREIFVLPMVNPDGYIYDGNGDLSQSAHWRKNRNDSTPTSAIGVDLNRNWACAWGNASSDPGSGTYQGEAPFSEYETQSISDWMKTREIETYHNMHSYAGTLLIPWCYTMDHCPHDSWYREMADDMTQHTSIQGDPSQHYSYGQAGEEIGYTASGGANDWGYDGVGAVGLTFEQETYGSGFYPPTSDIMSINQDVDDALIYQARVADTDIGTGSTDIFPPYPYLVFGDVTDGSGNPVTNETVTIKNMDTGETISVNTDDNGYYELDFGTMTTHGYTDSDSFCVMVGGTAQQFTIGDEWGQRIDLTYSQPKTHDVSLNQGWNFISTKLLPEDTSLTSILDDPSNGVSGNYDKVMSYSNPYRSFDFSIWEDDFETDKGWTFSGGEWERTAPQGLGGSSYGNPDPSSAYSGSNVLGYDLTSDGDYENSIGSTYWATSPSIDLSGYSGVSIQFERWLNLEQHQYDEGYIEVYDGSSWNQIWVNPSSTITESSWNHISYNVSAYADGNSDFRVRFGLGPTDAGWYYSGWNIDDFKVTYEEYVYDKNATEWRTYEVGRADHYNTLTDLSPDIGFWIHMTSSDTLTVSGYRISSSTIELKPGWNMVGYPSNTTGNNGLPTEVDKVGYYESSDPYHVAYDHNPGSFSFTPGEGYWIHNPTGSPIDWTINF